MLLAKFRRVEVYTFTDDDGTTAAWNATLGRDIAVREGVEKVRFNPEQNGVDLGHIQARYPEMDWERVRSMPFTDLAEPLLFVPWRGKSLLIDGWHRMAKCVLMGGFDLPAYLLSEDQADRCRVEEVPR